MSKVSTPPEPPADAEVTRGLEHPLPAGMRDLLPEEAWSRRTLARIVLQRFVLHGYAAVALPAFEFADVLERGLGTLDPEEVLRFVEPESGAVAALRPDMTPQIARLVATRLRGRPPPYRLAYEGTVLRRRSGRARKHKQIPQVGFELLGVAGPEGDLELLAVAVDALRAAGLEDFAVDVGDAGIMRALLRDVPGGAAQALSSALGKRDEYEVEVVCREAGIPHAALLRELLHLHGGRDAVLEGQRLLAGTGAAEAAARLLELYDGATSRGLAPRLTADLGDVRGFAYYTGPLFHVFADGPGEALGSGGRYDELLGRFRAPMPAAGFAVDLDRLAWALRSAGRLPSPEPSVVLVGAEGARAAMLREQGLSVVCAPAWDDAIHYARGWGHTFVVGDDAALHVATSLCCRG